MIRSNTYPMKLIKKMFITLVIKMDSLWEEGMIFFYPTIAIETINPLLAFHTHMVKNKEAMNFA